MRKMIQKVIFTATTALVFAFSVAIAPSVSAMGTQVVDLTKIQPGTNATCEKGTKKIFIVSVRVQPGERILSHGAFELQLKSGKKLTDDGFKQNNRLVKYYLYPQSRAAKVSRNLSQSYTFLEATSGAAPTAVVKSVCKTMAP